MSVPVSASQISKYISLAFVSVSFSVIVLFRASVMVDVSVYEIRMQLYRRGFREAYFRGFLRDC